MEKGLTSSCSKILTKSPALVEHVDGGRGERCLGTTEPLGGTELAAHVS